MSRELAALKDQLGRKTTPLCFLSCQNRVKDSMIEGVTCQTPSPRKLERSQHTKLKGRRTNNSELGKKVANKQFLNEI